METIKYYWRDFNFDISYIERQIRKSNWEPTLIVGVLRGGGVPAITLSHRFNVPVRMLNWSTRDFKKKNKKELYDIVVPKSGAKDRILIVDDIVDSGETIGGIKCALKDMVDISEVKYSALMLNTDQNQTIDYYAGVIRRSEDPRWLVFPWEEA